VWSQNTKNITLTHVGGSYSAIIDIAKKASEDLGFKVEMQTAPHDALLSRLLTQPNSIDIADIEYFFQYYMISKGTLQPIDLEKRFKWWDKVVPIFTKGEYEDGRKVSTQGGGWGAGTKLHVWLMGPGATIPVRPVPGVECWTRRGPPGFGVTERSVLSSAPAMVAVNGGRPVRVRGWAGPWPVISAGGTRLPGGGAVDCRWCSVRSTASTAMVAMAMAMAMVAMAMAVAAGRRATAGRVPPNRGSCAAAALPGRRVVGRRGIRLAGAYD